MEDQCFCTIGATEYTQHGAARVVGLTCGEVAASERLQDAVHGPHVEQEAKLRDAHGHQAEQEGGGGDGF